MGGQFRFLPGSPAAGLLSDLLQPGNTASIPAEYQPCRRVNADVADRYPFHLDIIQASIRLSAPVALEEAILSLIVTAPFSCFSSIVHID